MQKKTLVLVMLLVISLFMPLLQPEAAASCHIVVQSKSKSSSPEILDPGVEPYVQDGRLLVPMGSLAEALGFSGKYDEATRKATITGVGRRIELTLDSADAYVNGKTVKLDIPALATEGRIMVPLRFISEAFDYQVYFTQHIEREGTAYILPYNLVPSEEINALYEDKDALFENFPYPEAPWYFTLYLPEGYKTKKGVEIGQDITKLLSIYGIPEQPFRDLASYTADYTGTVLYPAPFTPHSGDYTKVELTFENGVLIQYKLIPPAD